MEAGNLHELHFIVKGHHLNTMAQSVLDLRHLFAGIGIDDAGGVHTQRLHQLDLSLRKRVEGPVKGEQTVLTNVHIAGFSIFLKTPGNTIV